MVPMVADGISVKISRYGLTAAVLFALALLCSLARAGTMAQLTLHSNLHLHRPMELCVGLSHSASCRSTIETALRTATTVSTRGRLYEALVSSSHTSRASLTPGAREPASFGAFAGEASAVAGHSLSLKFNDDPEWKRRAKVMARDGLPFMRLPESGNRELLVGITPHGMLGFSLKAKAD